MVATACRGVGYYDKISVTLCLWSGSTCCRRDTPQAALLRAYAVDRIHERDSLVEAALAFVVSTAETSSSIGGNGSTSANDESGYDAKAVQELLEWRERLGEETKNLDPGDAVDGKNYRIRTFCRVSSLLNFQAIFHLCCASFHALSRLAISEGLH